MKSTNFSNNCSRFKVPVFEAETDLKSQFITKLLQPLLMRLEKTDVSSKEVSDTNSNNHCKDPVNAGSRNKIDNAVSEESKASQQPILLKGREEAVFKNLVFKIATFASLSNERGINKVLFGRCSKYSGVYHNILDLAEISFNKDNEQTQVQKLTHILGVGFDGKKFIFARFATAPNKRLLEVAKSDLAKQTDSLDLPLDFIYEVFDLEEGIERLTILLRQQNKISLTKESFTGLISPKQKVIRENVNKIYRCLLESLAQVEANPEVAEFYGEWNRVFGVIYGDEAKQSNFVDYIEPLKELYHIDPDLYQDLDIKKYLFSLQTYFNIVIKLLVNNFLKQLINPEFEMQSALQKSVLRELFEGKDQRQQNIVANFFEIHFYEWFIYVFKFDMSVVKSTIEIINQFEMSSFLLKPETMQDILQEVYMGLIPEQLRHLMGEYFTPDWAVEFVLENVCYTGDINKRVCDPTCGSGAFLLQSLKKLTAVNNIDSSNKVDTVVNNIVGFDINPISAIAAKANYILALFSNLKGKIQELVPQPIHIPIYISDSVLTPVVYSEQNKSQLVVKTHLGDFVLPKFANQQTAHAFLDSLNEAVYNAEISGFTIAQKSFLAAISRLGYKQPAEVALSTKLFEQLHELHTAGKNSFWGKIFKNSFAPIMINEKFDYVVGNPPWISWKSMSKTYREGTLEVWQSYGIFEKNAYDKKTTHDDFGMAVTYVAIDYYLKEHGKLGFLLPASFIKSSKGGQGFRRFNIVCHEQNIPFAVYQLDDFSAIKLFTIPTMAFFVEKNKKMRYPMKAYQRWSYRNRAEQFDSHAKWSTVKPKLVSETLTAFPVSKKDIQSSWLTISKDLFALTQKVLATKTSIPEYKGRKGIEPAGAKGVYILETPTAKPNSKNLIITNDISRQRRRDILEKGSHTGEVEADLVFPMLGGRNIQRWRVVSNEYMLVPHTAQHKYGIPEEELIVQYPLTHKWLNFYRKELFASRVQNGKFFDAKNHPFYRLDNVGEYTYSSYKVLWKEQTGSMSAVVVGKAADSLPDYPSDLLGADKTIVTDSKVLFLSLEKEMEAYFVCGVLNAPTIRLILDSYAVSTNRGVDVLEHLFIPKFAEENTQHLLVAELSKTIHQHCRVTPFPKGKEVDTVLEDLEAKLDQAVIELFQ